MELQIIHLPGKQGSDYSNLLYVGRENSRNLKFYSSVLEKSLGAQENCSTIKMQPTGHWLDCLD